jgi:hypothetical protein
MRSDEGEAGRMRVQSVFWNSLGHGSVAHALTELMDNLPPVLVDRRLWSLGRDPASRAYVNSARPDVFFRALSRLEVSAAAQGRFASMRALKSIRPGDIVYFWPPYDLNMIKRAQARGAIVIAERTNCMDATGRARLADAYARRGMELPRGSFSPQSIHREQEQMRQCDFVTAPNPLVAQSLLDAGIPRTKILDTFYGFNPVRLASAIGIDRP